MVGEQDAATASDLRYALQQSVATYPLTVVDLRGVQFMDCAGLSALMSAHRRAGEQGAALRLRR
ncbi:STAS domain-containing protein [Streptomyces mirabilis]|uniref:STAS domain-containing protein n=1 Tax=Streptomyces mirabilis TaxID=68239 RepID=UPI0033212EBC